MELPAPGMDLHLTPIGEALACEREWAAVIILAGIDWTGIIVGVLGHFSPADREW